MRGYERLAEDIVILTRTELPREMLYGLLRA